MVGRDSKSRWLRTLSWFPQMHLVPGDVEQFGAHTGYSAPGRVNGKVSTLQPRSCFLLSYRVQCGAHTGAIGTSWLNVIIWQL